MTFLQLLVKLSSVSVLTSLLTLFTSLFFGKVMAVEDFGAYSYYQSILVLSLNIIPFGSGLALTVFLYRSHPSKLNRIVNNAVFVLLPFMLSLAFALILCYSLFGDGEFDVVFLIMLINVFMMSTCIICIDYLRAKQRILVYATLLILFTLATTVASATSYYIFSNVLSVYLGSLFFLIIPFLYSVRVLNNDFDIKFKFGRKIKTLKWALSYGLPIVSSTTVMSFLVVGDKILLESNSSKQELGIYSVGVLLASTTLFLVNNFAGAWGTYLFKKIPSITSLELTEYYNGLKRHLLLVIPVALLIYFFQYSVYIFFFAEKYPGLEFTILSLTFGYCVLGAAKYFMGFLNYFGKNVIILYSGISAVIILLGCFYLLPVDKNLLALYVTISLLFQFCLLWFVTNIEVRKYVNKSVSKSNL